MADCEAEPHISALFKHVFYLFCALLRIGSHHDLITLVPHCVRSRPHPRGPRQEYDVRLPVRNHLK